MKTARGPNISPTYKKQFCARVRSARLAVKYLYPHMKDFEAAMGLPPDYWKHYEKDRILQADLVEKFCRLTGVSAWVLFTGKHKASEPTEPEPVEVHQKKRRYA